MTINYPNGKIYKGKSGSPSSAKKQDTVYYGKRGMSLEEEISRSNQFYLINNQAVIHKKPTPIQVVKVDYPRRSAAVIREAYYRHSSTTDFNGVYKGYYLDFEAKETRNKTSFPLKNFHDHQLNHMESCRNQGGIVFVIIAFSSLRRAFLLGYESLAEFWQKKDQKGSRKSIPLSFIEEKGYEILYGLNPPLDYLKAVDQLIFDLHK